MPIVATPMVNVFVPRDLEATIVQSLSVAHWLMARVDLQDKVTSVIARMAGKASTAMSAHRTMLVMP